MAGSLLRYFKHCLRQYSRDNCAQLAAAISYYVLFSIVPLTFFLVSVFGLVIRSERVRSDVVRQVVDTLRLEKGDVDLELQESRLRQQGLTVAQVQEVKAALQDLTAAERQQVADQLRISGSASVGGHLLQAKDVLVTYRNSISDTLSSVAGASPPFTVFSVLFSAWSASAMFGSVRKALNVVWKVDYQKPYFQQKLMDLFMVVGFGLLVLASVFGTGALRALREVSDDALGPLSTGTGLFWGTLPYVLPGIASFAVFALLYRFVPAVSVRFRDVWLGALVAALLFEALKNGFAFYVTHFRSYDLLYGSLGGILLFLTGVYFASSILLLGGELATAMPGLGAGAFAAVRDPSRPQPGLIAELPKEVASFLRGLVLSPKRERRGDEHVDEGHHQAPP
jgi:YihY family inner membrane protein